MSHILSPRLHAVTMSGHCLYHGLYMGLYSCTRPGLTRYRLGYRVTRYVDTVECSGSGTRELVARGNFVTPRIGVNWQRRRGSFS